MDHKTVDLDYDFRATEEEPLNVERTYSQFANDIKIVESEEVPENTARFRVTDNAEVVEPFVEEYESGKLVGINWYYVADDIKNFMESKNVFLEGIKKREYISFHNTGIEGVEIIVNPASKPLVRIN